MNKRARPATATPKMAHPDYISREDAVQQLGVKLQSFYTYVSRGLIRRHELPGHKRKLYLKSDVERLAAKSHARSNTGAKAGDAMRYGNPVVQTWICEITPEGPRYRNRLATDLAAANVSFESVAQLLWSGRFRHPRTTWRREELPDRFSLWARRAADLGVPGEADPVRLMSFLLTTLRASGAAEDDSPGGNTVPLAHLLLQMFAGVAGYLGPRGRFEPFREGDSIALCMARGFGRERDDEVVEAINAALVICAEHELAPPTFAARICASTGADLYACVATGVMAHMGPLQGGGTDGAEDLLDEALQPGGRGRLPSAPWSSRYDLPGFNHPIYARDPRASFLLDRAGQLTQRAAGADEVMRVIAGIEAEMHFHPSITAALVVLGRSLGLPRRSANLIFSVGRTAGWIAHVLEQRMAGFMLRPRAHFVPQGESTAAAAGVK